jgi:hypothetical protein
MNPTYPMQDFIQSQKYVNIWKTFLALKTKKVLVILRSDFIAKQSIF